MKNGNILYSNLKDDTIREAAVRLNAECGITGIICDFDCKPDLCSELSRYGISENYYRIKLYEKPTTQQIAAEIRKAKEYGFKGFAVDAEPYSESDIWMGNPLKCFADGAMLSEMVMSAGFEDLLIYPENLGGDKYKYYDTWMDGVLSGAKRGLKIHLFMERCYDQREPWNILNFYLRNKIKYLLKPRVKISIGIWQIDKDENGVMRLFACNEFWAKLQANTAKFLGEKLFVYTEGTNIAFYNSDKMTYYRSLLK